MLEIKGVTKIYKSRGGVETRALDNVSISFGETGLVFLLGKSGSGKSTLLNVSGGLDEPTWGEIVVKGKSSKEFSSSDFDSYRNTFVGFVFQEYNILDEFNVEDNIALALELQGKPKDKSKINALLREVDLESFAKRKPNTLSGGQKQRIAIARALIKDPQIIMADEPTGALDSNTGKQVFDTLKELSKTRLVIVVSHDREFAEIYGDRIVELSDGKIISDVSKSSVQPERLDENITVVGGNTLCIKKGAKIDETHFEKIKEFIKNTDGDVIISNGGNEISAFKKAARMSDEGATDKFENTEEDKIEIKSYTSEESKFIRSRLPILKAAKIGASGLKLKPIRLAFTIFLSFIAFTMFGLMSTLMLYDKDSVAASSFANSDYQYLNINKKYMTRVKHYDDDYSYSSDAYFTKEEVDKFASEYGDETFGYYAFSGYNGTNIINVQDTDTQYYVPQINKCAHIPENHSIMSGLIGSYPKAANEIVISRYIFDVFKKCGFYDIDAADGSSAKITVNSERDVIGKNLYLSVSSKQAFKITGVFESEKLPSKFDELKETHSTSDYLKIMEFRSYLIEGLSLMLGVSAEFHDEFGSYFVQNSQVEINPFEESNTWLDFYVDGYVYENNEWTYQYGEVGDGTRFVKAYEGESPFEIITFDGKMGALENNETIINVRYLTTYEYGNNVIKYFYDEIMAGNIVIDDLDTTHSDSVYTAACDKFSEFYEAVESYMFGYRIESGYDEDGKYYEEMHNLTDKELEEIIEKIASDFKNFPQMDFRIAINDGIGDNVKNMKAVGMYLSKGKIIHSGVYLSKSFIDNNLSVGERSETTNYVPEKGAVISGIYIPYNRTVSAYKDLVSKIGVNNILENDVFYLLNNSLTAAIDTVNSAAELMSTVFLWVGLILAVFASLLLFNFISVSIANKIKEIGILRAVGARGLDVFKIFFSEAGIIVSICAVLALIGTFIGCSVINGILRDTISFSVTMFVVGVPSVLVLIGIAVLVAVISTFIPVYFAARKKPVDSIRAL